MPEDKPNTPKEQFKLASVLSRQPKSLKIIISKCKAIEIVLTASYQVKEIVQVEGGIRKEVKNVKAVQQSIYEMLKKSYSHSEIERRLQQQFTFNNQIIKRREGLIGGGCGASNIQQNVTLPLNQQQRSSGNQPRTIEQNFIQAFKIIDENRIEIIQEEKFSQINPQLRAISNLFEDFGVKLLLPQIDMFRNHIWVLLQIFKDYHLLRLENKITSLKKSVSVLPNLSITQLPPVPTPPPPSQRPVAQKKDKTFGIEQFLKLLENNINTQAVLDIIVELKQVLQLNQIKISSFNEKDQRTLGFLHKEIILIFKFAESWGEETIIQASWRMKLQKMQLQIGEISLKNVLSEYINVRLKFWKMQVEGGQVIQGQKAVKMQQKGASTLRCLTNDESWMNNEKRVIELLIKFSYELQQMYQEQKFLRKFIGQLISCDNRYINITDPENIQQQSEPRSKATQKSAITRCVQLHWNKSETLRFVIFRILNQIYNQLVSSKQDNDELFDQMCIFIFNNYKKEAENSVKIVIEVNKELYQSIQDHDGNEALEKWIKESLNSTKSANIDQIKANLDNRANKLVDSIKPLRTEQISSLLKQNIESVLEEFKEEDIIPDKYIRESITNTTKRILILGGERGIGKTFIIKLVIERIIFQEKIEQGSEAEDHKTITLYIKQQFISCKNPSIEDILSRNPYDQSQQQIDAFKSSANKKIIIIDGFHKLTNNLKMIQKLEYQLQSWKNAFLIITTRETMRELKLVKKDIMFKNYPYQIIILQNDFIFPEEFIFGDERKNGNQIIGNQKVPSWLPIITASIGYQRTKLLCQVPVNIYLLESISTLGSPDKLKDIFNSIHNQQDLIEHFCKVSLTSALIASNQAQNVPQQILLCQEYLEILAGKIFMSGEEKGDDDYSVQLNFESIGKQYETSDAIAFQAGILRKYQNEEFFFAKKKVSTYFSFGVILEYYIAKNLMREIVDGSDKNMVSYQINKVDLNPLGKDVRSNILHTIHDLYFVSEDFPNDRITRSAINYIQSARRNVQNLGSSNLEKGASNLVSALFITRFNLKGINLSGLSLKNAYLRHSNQPNVNLAGSELTNENLYYSQFPYESFSCENKKRVHKYTKNVDIKQMYNFQSLLYLQSTNHIYAISHGIFIKFSNIEINEGEITPILLEDYLILSQSTLFEMQECKEFIYCGDGYKIYQIHPKSLNFCSYKIKEYSHFTVSDNFPYPVIATSFDQTLTIFKINDFKIQEICHYKSAQKINLISYIPQSSKIVTCTPTLIRVYNFETKLIYPIYTVTTTTEILCISFQKEKQQQYMACGTKKKVILIGKIQDGQGTFKLDIIKIIEVHNNSINSCFFSPCHKYLINASDDSKISICDVNNNFKVVHMIQAHPDQVLCATFLKDSNTIASIGLNEYLVNINHLQVEAWEKVFVIEPSNFSTNAMDFSPNNKILATASPSKTIKIWNSDLRGMKPIQQLEGHKKAVITLQFSKSGKYLASGSNDNSVILWNVNNNFERISGSNIEFKDAVACLAFSPDEQYLGCGSWDGTFKIFNVESKKILETKHKPIELHTHAVLCMAFNHYGELFATGSADMTIKVYDAFSAFSFLYSLERHKAWVYQLTFTYADDFLISASKDNTVKVWRDSNNFCTIESIDESNFSIISLAASQNSTSFLSGARDGRIRLYSLDEKGKVVKNKKSFEESNQSINALSFSCDGQHFAMGAKKDMKLWEIDSFKAMNLIKHHKKMILQFLFSSDGHMISIDEGGQLKLWDSQQQLKQVRKIKKSIAASDLTLEISLDSRFLVAIPFPASNILILSLLHSKFISQTLKMNSQIIGAQFSPNGEYLAVYSENQTVVLLQFEKKDFKEVKQYDIQSITQEPTISSKQYSLYFTPNKADVSKSFPFLYNIDRANYSRLKDEDHLELVKFVTFSPDSTIMFIYQGDQFAKIDLDPSLLPKSQEKQSLNQSPIRLFKSSLKDEKEDDQDQDQDYYSFQQQTIEKCLQLNEKLNNVCSISFDGKFFGQSLLNNVFVWKIKVNQQQQSKSKDNDSLISKDNDSENEDQQNEDSEITRPNNFDYML